MCAAVALAALAGCNGGTAAIDVSLLFDRSPPDIRPDSSADHARPPDTAASVPQLTVLVDNYPFNPSLKTGWGYACAVTGLPKTVLLDTGMDSTTLLGNMGKLSFARQGVDQLVISHDHLDHTAGLDSFLKQSPATQVYLLSSFSLALKQVAQQGGKVTELSDATPVLLSEGVRSLGALPGQYQGTPTPEQSLAIDTPLGIVIITGCAHPGIVEIVKHAKQALHREVLLVMGGFHLLEATAAQVATVVDALEQLGVRYVGPSHCTGDAAIAAFKSRYAERFLQVGAGTIVDTRQLTK
jgi:7,8-dihydropterin-6-yl-methyl-4-(beta-D-ribofuranosyl)aminobenzene 5'-phosphate synthase